MHRNGKPLGQERQRAKQFASEGPKPQPLKAYQHISEELEVSDPLRAPIQGTPEYGILRAIFVNRGYENPATEIRKFYNTASEDQLYTVSAAINEILTNQNGQVRFSQEGPSSGSLASPLGTMAAPATMRPVFVHANIDRIGLNLEGRLIVEQSTGRESLTSALGSVPSGYDSSHAAEHAYEQAFK
jgi:hypothetical protein